MLLAESDANTPQQSQSPLLNCTVRLLFINHALSIRQQCPFDLTAQAVAHHNPSNTINLPSTLEKDNRRYAINLALIDNLTIDIRIESDKHYTPLILFTNRLKLRVLYFARATIFRPDVHQHHLLCL